jgi:ABC-type glycerol-3-phosphate transport system permease component
LDAKSPLVAVLAAIGLCVANTLAGYVVSRMAFGKDLNVFLGMVFGSLGVRAIVILAAAWFCLSVLGMHQVAFSLTFAIVCFLLLMGEILFFHRSFEQSKRQVRRPVTELLKKKVADMIIGMRPAPGTCLA